MNQPREIKGAIENLVMEIALMRDDVKTFSGYMKARLGGERYA